MNIKFLYALLLIAAPCGSLIAKKDKDSVLDDINQRTAYIARIVSQINQQEQCSTVITAADIGTSGYVINGPGYYCLGSDVSFSPVNTTTYNPLQSAIQVSEGVSNVVIDLKGHTLSQASKSVFNVDGILIQPGCDNISVINGTIRDFSSNGIEAGIQRTAGLATPPTITNLTISDVKLFNNMTDDPSIIIYLVYGAGGIVVRNTQNLIINNVQANQNYYAGLSITDSVDLTINNSHFDNSISGNQTSLIPAASYPFAAGAVITSDACNNPPSSSSVLCETAASNALLTGNIVIINSTFNGNTSGGEAHGLAILNSGPASPFNNMVIDSCQFNNTAVTVSDPAVVPNLYQTNLSCIALYIIGPQGTCTINNCTFGQTAAVVDTPLYITGKAGKVLANGIYFDGPGEGIVTVSNCSFAQTSAILNAPLYTSFTSGGTVFLNGIHNSNAASGQFTISNCDIAEQTFQNNSGIGAIVNNQSVYLSGAAPYGGAPGSDVYIKGCRFVGSQNLNPVSGGVPSPSLLTAGGLVATIYNNCVVEDCFSTLHTQSGVTPGVSGEFSIVSGFRATRGAGSAIFRGCTALTNSDTGAGIAAGFSTRDASNNNSANNCCIFEGSIAENNTSVGGTNGIGFDLYNFQNGKVINNYSECNNVGISMSEKSISTSCKNNIVCNNVIVGNTEYGIYDTSLTSTYNAYYQNQAKANGSTPAGSTDTNFDGGTFSAPTGFAAPVRKWVMPAAPQTVDNNGVTGEQLDNISINAL